ncbi:MAG: glycosyltransferase [Rickettsiales bacterium]|jgi:glycosyltransferase involved in cell wall biosynthesis|nr:glycosyltransferase [Rickettsiales bacterium]
MQQNPPPAISIIVPIYKVQDYIRDALISVQNQTFADWECICIDDGSPDDCADIVREFAAADPRFILIQQENAGVSMARNHGLDLARGKYFAFLDPDDVYAPAFLETAFAAAEKYKCDIVQMDLSHVPEDFELSYTKTRAPVNLDQFLQKYIQGAERVKFFWMTDFIYGGLWCYCWRNLYRRKALGDIRFVPDIHPGEDDIYIMAVMNRACSYAKIESFGVYYRKSKASVIVHLSNPENIGKKIANRCIVTETSFNLIQQWDIPENLRTTYMGIFSRSLYDLVVMAFGSGQKSLCRYVQTRFDRKMLARLIPVQRLRIRLGMTLFFNGYFNAAHKILYRKIKK